MLVLKWLSSCPKLDHSLWPFLAQFIIPLTPFKEKDAGVFPVRHNSAIELYHICFWDSLGCLQIMDFFHGVAM
jgi:hypothetical protein